MYWLDNKKHQSGQMEQLLKCSYYDTEAADFMDYLNTP